MAQSLLNSILISEITKLCKLLLPFKEGSMKRYIILFAIFITAIFFYPVFAHAEKIGFYISQNQLSEPIVLFVLGAGLLVTASLTRRLLTKNRDEKESKSVKIDTALTQNV